MSDRKMETDTKSVKLREFSRMLKAYEAFLESISYENEDLVLFIKELRGILKPYGNLDGQRVLKALKHSLEGERIRTHETSSTLFSEAGIRLVPLDELKSIVMNENISKKDLLFVAQKRMGIPTGSLRNMRRDVIRDRILSEIENIGKFDTIRRKAAE